MTTVQQTTSFLQQVIFERGQTAAEARFTAFMKELRGVAFIKDRQGRYVYINAACAKLIGISIEDALYKTDHDLWPPQFADVYKRNDQAVFSDGETFEGIEPVFQDGEVCYWLMHRFPIVDGDSGEVFLGGIGVDIAGRRQFEDRVLRAREFELITKMAGGIAHHFNNILTVVLGYTRIVLDDLGPHHHASAQLQEVLRAANLAADLTSQLLSFSRRQILQFREVDLNSVLLQAEPALRAKMGHSIQLRLDMGPNLMRVRADAKHVRQVIEAMAFNACDAMPSGGRLTIATSNVQSGRTRCVRISIRDTGEGMNEETKLRLFEPFFTTKEVGQGVGLGLSSVYGIVKQHGGEITVQSELGSGTTFEVFLPAIETASVIPSDQIEPRIGVMCADFGGTA